MGSSVPTPQKVSDLAVIIDRIKSYTESVAQASVRVRNIADGLYASHTEADGTDAPRDKQGGLIGEVHNRLDDLSELVQTLHAQIRRIENIA